MLSFRLDEASRRQVTERVLAGSAGASVREIAAGLEPGGAFAALLVEQAWIDMLGGR